MSDTPRAIRPLLESVTEDVRLLLEQTASLARAEATAALRSAAFYVAAAAAGVFIAVAGLLVLVSALVLIAIALGLPPWAAAVSVAVLLIVIGAGAAYFSVASLGHVEFDLRHTRRSITETIAWLKAQSH
jgi:bacteriorhodopsin